MVKLTSEMYPEWLRQFDIGEDDEGEWIGAPIEPHIVCVGYTDEGEAIMVEVP
jgi:hypothetical protein